MQTPANSTRWHFSSILLWLYLGSVQKTEASRDLLGQVKRRSRLRAAYVDREEAAKLGLRVAGDSPHLGAKSRKPSSTVDLLPLTIGVSKTFQAEDLNLDSLLGSTY